MKTTFQVKGTHCPSCKALIEDICKDSPGVTDCTIDFKTGKGVIEHSAKIDLDALKKEIESAGSYKVSF